MKLYKSKKRNALSKKQKNTKRKRRKTSRKRTKMKGGFVTFRDILNTITSTVIQKKNNNDLFLFDTINSKLKLK